VIDLAEQHAAVAGEIHGGELGDDLAEPQIGKEQRLRVTVCRARRGAARSVLAFIHSPSGALPAALFDPL
jgi:hypothetical protein